MSRNPDDAAPILTDKHHAAPSIFTPHGLLREARRQKALRLATVPSVCALDPDGDLVRRLIAEGDARRDPAWACYHTELDRLERDGLEVGLIGGRIVRKPRPMLRPRGGSTATAHPAVHGNERGYSGEGGSPA